MEVTETPVKSLRRIDISVAEAEDDEDSSLTSVTGFYGSAIAPAGMTPSVWVGAPNQNLPPGTEQPGTSDRDGQNPDPDPPPTSDPGGDLDPPMPDVEPDPDREEEGMRE